MSSLAPKFIDEEPKYKQKRARYSETNEGDRGGRVYTICSYGVVVSTQDFESCVPSSTLGTSIIFY